MNSITKDTRTYGSTTVESPAPALKKLATNRDTLRIIASLIVQPQECYRTLELVLKKHKGRQFRSHILLRAT